MYLREKVAKLTLAILLCKFPTDKMGKPFIRISMIFFFFLEASRKLMSRFKTEESTKWQIINRLVSISRELTSINWKQAFYARITIGENLETNTS